MTQVFFDTNIVLDVAFSRKPYFEASQKMLVLIEQKKISGHISAITIPTIYYLLQKEIGHAKAKEYIHNLLKLFKVVEANKEVFDRALNIVTKDFEDAVQIASAQLCKASFIITRNAKDFSGSSIAIISPSEYLADHQK